MAEKKVYKQTNRQTFSFFYKQKFDIKIRYDEQLTEPIFFFYNSYIIIFTTISSEPSTYIITTSGQCTCQATYMDNIILVVSLLAYNDG